MLPGGRKFSKIKTAFLLNILNTYFPNPHIKHKYENKILIFSRFFGIFSRYSMETPMRPGNSGQLPIDRGGGETWIVHTEVNVHGTNCTAIVTSVITLCFISRRNLKVIIDIRTLLKQHCTNTYLSIYA